MKGASLSRIGLSVKEIKDHMGKHLAVDDYLRSNKTNVN